MSAAAAPVFFRLVWTLGLALTAALGLAGPAAQGQTAQGQTAHVQTAQAQTAEGPQTGLPRAPVTITTADGRAHLFEAEIADTRRTRNVGMMFRTRMAPDEAMLFVYEEPQEAAFWMRNTLIPLDILFVSANGRIHRIFANARPRDETALRSRGPVLSVVEIPGGRAAELGIAVGDRVASVALTPLWPKKRAEQLR